MKTKKIFIFFLLVPLLLLGQWEDILSQISPNPSLPYQVEKIGGGLTNQNWVLSQGNNRYFVRIGTPSAVLLGAGIEQEHKNMTLVESQGMSPRVFLFDREKNILVTEFIESESPSIDLRNPQTLEKTLSKIRQLHQSDIVFPRQCNPFQVVREYLRILEEHNAHLPSAFEKEVLPAIAALENLLPQSISLSPCHLDLHHLNLLEKGNTIWLIDWEYAGMSDPLYDLAALCSIEYFSEEESEHLLELYLQHPPTQVEKDRLYCLNTLANAIFTLWCHVQAQLSDIPDVSFEELSLTWEKPSLEKVRNPRFKKLVTPLAKCYAL